MLVLSGDIGGTHTRLQITEFTAANAIKALAIKRYNNSGYSNLLDIIETFLVATKLNKNDLTSVCFGVAGPVINGRVNVTNLPWIIDEVDLKHELKVDKIALINDFAAIGYGIGTLKPEDLLTLQVGKRLEDGIKAYIGAGTGLGIGFITCYQGTCICHSTEGGHVDFAPTDNTQLELLKYLRKKYHRVSFERVLSGMGLTNIYNFVRDNRIFGEEENAELRFLIKSNNSADIAALVAEYAIKHKDIMAMRALDIFVRIYGAAVGNLALTTLPFGGLYVVGGIAPKLLEQIKKGGFLEAFADKGRMSDLLKRVPLHIVLNEDTGLLGAAVFAHNMVL